MTRNRVLLLAMFGMIGLVLMLNWAGPGSAAQELDTARVQKLLESDDLEWHSYVMGTVDPGPARPHAMAPVVIEKQGFEGDFPPAGWQAIDRAAQQDRVQPRYVWGKQTCEVEPLIGGSAATWMASAGSEGTKLPCVSPYPAQAKVFTWLSYTLDLTPFPNGFTIKMKAFIDQPLNTQGADTNFQIAIIDLDTSQGIAYNISSPRPLSWLPLELPEEDLAQFGGLAQVAVIIAYQDNPAPGGKVGLVVDNVVYEGLPIEKTATPTMTNTPAASPTPTATATPVRKYTFLPVVVYNTDTFPIPTPVPMVGAEVVFGTAVDGATGAVTGQARTFPSGVSQLCARERWYGQIIGTNFRWQWYRNGNPVDLEGLNGSLDVQSAEGFKYQCATTPPNGSYEVRVYIGGSANPTTAGSATVGP